MKKIVFYLTLLPWFLYFSKISKNNLKSIRKAKINFEWIKNNFFKIFRFDNLILIGVFVFFAKFYPDASQIWLVKTLLFSIINLYLFINTYYEKEKNPSHIVTDDVSTLLIILIISILPVIYYIATGHYTITYYVLFGYNFFSFFIVLVSKKANDLINLIVRRKSNESK